MRPATVQAARRAVEERDAALAAETAAYASGKPLTAAGDPALWLVRGPDPQPCVCGAPRHAHGGPKRLGAAPRCARYRADVVAAAVDAAVRAREATLSQDAAEADWRERSTRPPRTPGTWSIGASDTSSCPRAVWYRNLPPEGFVPADEDKRAALVGSLIHASAVDVRRRLYPWREFEFPVRIPGLDRESRGDSYDPITCEVEDLKTAGQRKWDMLGPSGPDEATWDQVLIYALGKIRAGDPVRTVKLTYIQRDNGHDAVFTRRYDEAAAQRALDRLIGLATAFDLGQEIPRPAERTGPTNDWMCARCFARRHCWNMPAAERAGRSPEGYTRLGPDPDEDAIVWAIKEVIDARAAETAAKKRKVEAETLIIGLEPREYGGVVQIKPGRIGNVDWKGYATLLEEYYSLPADIRPPLDKVKKPRYRDTTPSAAVVPQAVRDKRAKGSLPPLQDGATS